MTPAPELSRPRTSAIHKPCLWLPLTSVPTPLHGLTMAVWLIPFTTVNSTPFLLPPDDTDPKDPSSFDILWSLKSTVMGAGVVPELSLLYRVSSSPSLTAMPAFCHCDNTLGTCNSKRVYCARSVRAFTLVNWPRCFGLVEAQNIIAGVWQRGPAHNMAARKMII